MAYVQRNEPCFKLILSVSLLCAALAWQRAESEAHRLIVEKATEQQKSRQTEMLKRFGSSIVTEETKELHIETADSQNKDNDDFLPSISQIHVPVAKKQNFETSPPKPLELINLDCDATEDERSYEVYKKPIIYFGTRTHKQISQIVKELKSTAYKPKMTILGSRNQYCIHKKVIKSSNRNDECKKLLVKSAICGVY